jgi:hypothetical protein
VFSKSSHFSPQPEKSLRKTLFFPAKAAAIKFNKNLYQFKNIFLAKKKNLGTMV